MMGEPRDRLMVEVDKSNKGLHLLLISWSRPVCYTSDLYRIHFDLIMQEDNPQVLNPSVLKLTLLRSKIEFMLTHSVENQLSDTLMFFN
jgi:hypothetical protein